MNAHPRLPLNPLRRREVLQRAAALGAFLKPLDAQLYRDLLQAVALGLPTFFPPRFQDPSPLPDLDILLACLIQYVRTLELEREETLSHHAQLSGLLQQLEGFASKKRLLSTSLAEHHPLQTRLRRWRHVQRYYDGDSLLASVHARRVSLDQALTVCMKLMQGVARASLARASDGQAVRTLLKTLGLEGFLATRLSLGPLAVRREALRLLGLLVGPLPALERTALLGTEVLRSLHRCLDPQEDRELQRRAFEVEALVEPEHTLVVITHRLRSPELHRDDFYVRRALMRLLGTVLQSPTSLGLLQSLLRAPDPSEGVRMTLAEALGGWPSALALELLASTLGAARLEPSARVRAQVAVVAGHWLEAQTAADWAPGMQDVFGLLQTLLTEDPAELVRRTALELLLDAGLKQMPGKSALREAVCERLRERLCHPELLPIERTRCANALESLLIREDPVLDQARSLLETRLKTLALGQSTVYDRRDLPLEPLEAAEAALGRLLAHLAQEDFGLYATRTRTGWRITRGEHFVRRLWRILYELNHPTPNKRQGVLHTVGRAFRGELRAHPGRLAEITATTVPGERLFSEREGSWGRYLPLPDDLLCLPLLRRRPVRMFSGEGVTEVLPPPSILRHLAARAQVTRHFARLSALRRHALNATEPEEQGLYVKTLRDELGVDVRFSPHAARGSHTLTRGNESASWTLPESLRPLFPALATTPLGDGSRSSVEWSARGLARALETLSVLMQEMLVRVTGSVAQLALLVLALLLYSLARGMVRMQSLRRARRRIPLVVGGWGTRGKSGTERLKAAMFQGLGYEVLVKTTGCEAMVIHAQPESVARELFLYRPYDKATIWEQADCLTLASKLNVQVFLYECMALQPRYVRVIQNDWSQDDVSTLTNCYPDHEDIQGPAGVNVAWCISEFIREGGQVLTSEEQMLPVLKEAARTKHATLEPVPLRTADLIPADYLERLPYQEHPRNVGLVLALGQRLGFDPDHVLLALGDHVVPDIGVLKAYPYAEAWGRHMQFVSGNSANERTGFMSNWVRMGFDAHDPKGQPGEWIITVVNNRADRVARSQVFAEILVRDVSAHRHVLIGTNLTGLQQYLREALERRLSELVLFSPDDVHPLSEAVVERRRARFQKGVVSLKVPGLDAAGLIRCLVGWLQGLGLRHAPQAIQEDALLAQTVASWLELVPEASLVESLESWGATSATFHPAGTRADAARASEALGDASPQPAGKAQLSGKAPFAAVYAALIQAGVLHELQAQGRRASPLRLTPEALIEEVTAYFLREVARAARLRQVERWLERALAGAMPFEEVNDRMRRVYRELFMESVWPIEDPATTGDQIIRMLARVCPPGVRLRIMGTQNIKGTGLDFVYRWASVGVVDRWIKDLSDARRSRLFQTLTRLREHPDYGMVDACWVQETLTELKESGAGVWLSLAESLDQTLNHMGRVVQTRQAALEGQGTAASGGLGGSGFLTLLERVLEPLESVRRRARARALNEALVAGLLSQDQAAEALRLLNKEQKGGWLKKRVGG